MAKRTKGASPGLTSLDPRIDRKKLSRLQQTLRVERLVKKEGITRNQAVRRVVSDQIKRQNVPTKKKPVFRASSKPKEKKFVPSGPPKRDPFSSPLLTSAERRRKKVPARKRTKKR